MRQRTAGTFVYITARTVLNAGTRRAWECFHATDSRITRATKTVLMMQKGLTITAQQEQVYGPGAGVTAAMPGCERDRQGV